MFIEINYLAVLASVVASFALGFAWYGPLFGKQWIALMGIVQGSIDQSNKGMGKRYATMMLGSLATAYVLTHFVALLGVSAFMEAVQLAFWVWLGFMLPLDMGKALWESRSWKLVGIVTSYNLVMLILMTSILALWPW